MKKINSLQKNLTKLFLKTDYKMIDVTEKDITKRTALATGEILLTSKIIKKIKEKKMPKGDPITIAEIAGINGVKKTSDQIPLCHPLQLDHISLNIDINVKKNSVIVYCLVSAKAKTGVEMEALSGVNAALLTIYDLSKIIEPNLKIINIKLLIKSGGKTGFWINPDGIPEKIKKILSL